jgi:hypothetical protein
VNKNRFHKLQKTELDTFKRYNIYVIMNSGYDF